MLHAGLLRTPLVFSMTLLACGCVERPPLDTVKKAPGWENMSPLEMLREAGRICCDARTFEAVGRIEIPTDLEGAESGSIRWVFGPDGEYRFEQGSVLVVFDTEYIAFRRDGTWQGKPLYARGIQPEPQPPHDRYWGDVFMATAMATRSSAQFPIAHPRWFGASWTDQVYSNDTDFAFGEDVVICGHTCRTIVAPGPDEGVLTTFWIDSDLGLIRKYEMNAGESGTFRVTFDQLRLNPRLAPGEFAIPAEAKRAANRPLEKIRVAPPPSPCVPKAQPQNEDQ